MKVNIIAAIDQNNAIGKGNTLPWRLPADLALFKALTLGKIIIMGRKTWESIGCRCLPGRQTIVVSRDHTRVKTLAEDRGVINAPSLPDALGCAKALTAHSTYPEDVFVIGGSEIYALALPHTDTIYLSCVSTVVEGADAFFPHIDPEEWELQMSTGHIADGDKHTYDWHHQIWVRKE